MSVHIERTTFPHGTDIPSGELSLTYPNGDVRLITFDGGVPCTGETCNATNTGLKVDDALRAGAAVAGSIKVCAGCDAIPQDQ